jgi:Zn-dependent peptidase ImmA (M78 family)
MTKSNSRKVDELIKQSKLKAIDGKIRIGCIDYEIKIVDLLNDDEGNEIFGQCAYDECEIRILNRLAIQAKVATLWHEITHAILVNCGYVEEHDEQMVSAITNGILSVLRDT